LDNTEAIRSATTMALRVCGLVVTACSNKDDANKSFVVQGFLLDGCI
jgi:hypothetical protein